MDLEWIDNQPRQVEVGDRIKLVNMPDDPDPLKSGTEGVVTSVDTRMDVVGVKWDNGRTLNLVLGVDSFEILNEGASDKAIINKSMPSPTLKGRDISPSRTKLNNSFKGELKKAKVKDIKVESEELEGGKADKMTPQNIADKHDIDIKEIQKELEMGVEIEMEHTNSPIKAKEVVMDHLFEFPDYYSNKEHGLKVSEKGLEKVHEGNILENFFGSIGNAFGKGKNKDDQYDIKSLTKDLTKITDSIKTGSFRHQETIKNMIETFRDKYSEHSMIDTMMKSLYHEFDGMGEQEIEETTSAGGSSGAFSGPLGGVQKRNESRIIKVRDLLEGTTTINSGDYQNDSETPFDSNKDGWFWNDKPWWEGGETVDDIAQLDHNWKDDLLSVKMTKEELVNTVNLLEGEKTEEELEETTTASSSGQFQGPMFAAKDDESWKPGKKPIWKGGKIVQKVKNSGVLSEINKIKWHKDGSYVKLKDSCVKYNNQPWCSAGDADKPLILSKTTSDNISEVAKKLGISKEEIKKVVINQLSR
jgi:hypothetical protein